VANLRSSQKSNGLAGERPNYNTPRIPSMTPPHPSLSLMWVAFAVGGVAFWSGCGVWLMKRHSPQSLMA
jgi:hypothetical protein